MLRKNILFFGLVHGFLMLIITIWASNLEAIWHQGDLITKPWFVATLFDAYLGFLLFYLWLFFTTNSNIKRLIYLILIITTGNIFMGFIIAFRAYQAPNNITIKDFLLGKLQ